MSVQLVGGFAAPLSTILPVADNNVDAQLRIAQAGALGEAADAGHKHAIKRQAIPTQPIAVPFGSGLTLVNTILNKTTSDEESVSFFFTLQISQNNNSSWHGFNITNIAGFQPVSITPTGCYRASGNLTGLAPAPSMNMEFSVYFNTTIYMNVFTRNANTTYYISFIAKYIRT